MPGTKQGLLATLIALLVLMTAMIVIGTVVWLRRAPKGVPSQPNRPTSLLRGIGTGTAPS